MSLSPSLSSIIETLPEIRAALSRMGELILANAVFIGEIPAPTFGEEPRIRFLLDRFTETGLQNVSLDEGGNGVAILPGTGGNKGEILLVSHADTNFAPSVDHSIAVRRRSLTGPGIADNTLGLAVISILPLIMERIGVRLKSDLVLVSTSRSLGHGDLGGLRFFLENAKRPLRAGVCVAGVHLGRLSYSCLGMLRGEISCRVFPETDWKKADSKGAIVSLNKILSRILALSTPEAERTSIILGSIAAGTAFNTIPENGLLKFELRSEEPGMVEKVGEEIEAIIGDLSVETRSKMKLKTIARRQPGGIPGDHPLVQATGKIMKALHITPRVAPSVGELSALIAKKIPAVTVGLTRGRNLHEVNESIEIQPIFEGVTQLIALLRAIDGGLCDEN